MENAEFNGWAKVEVMGHSVHIGLVGTEVFGPAVLFKVESPSVPAREETLADRRYVSGIGYLPAGSVLKYEAIESTTVLLGAASIFRITPCSEQAAVQEVIRTNVKVSVHSVPPLPALAAAQVDGKDEPDANADFEDDPEVHFA